MQGMWLWSLVREIKSHMPWRNWAHKPQLESPCAATKDATWCNDQLHVTTKTWCSQTNIFLKNSHNKKENAQLCLTLSNPIGYTVYRILQARILEWVAFPFSRGSSQPRDGTQVSCIAGRFFTNWDIREAKKKTVVIIAFYMAGLSTVFTLSQNKPRIFI